MTVQIGLLLECFISYESETKPFSRNNTSAKHHQIKWKVICLIINVPSIGAPIHDMN